MEMARELGQKVPKQGSSQGAWRHGCAFAFCAVVLAGCGDGNDQATVSSCPVFTACGGDIEGSWDIEEMCVDGDWAAIAGIEQPECADAISNVRYLPNATLEVSSTTMEISGDFMLEMDLVVTEPCAQALTGDPMLRIDATVCSRLEASLNQPDPDSSIESATCDTAPGACHCTTSSSAMMHSLDTGTYRIEGDAYVTDVGERRPYCVEEDQLTIEGRLMGTSGLMILHRQ